MHSGHFIMRRFLFLSLLSVSTVGLASDNVAEDLARMGFSSTGGSPKAQVKSESARPAEVKAPVAEKAAEPQAEPMPVATAKASGSSSGLPKTQYRLGTQETTSTPSQSVNATPQSESSLQSAAPQPKGLEDELARMGFSKSH